MKNENISGYLEELLFYAYIIFFVSIVFSLRAVSSLCVALILLAGIAGNWKARTYLYNNKPAFLFFSGCLLLFLLQAASLLYTNNIAGSLSLLQRSSGFVLIPLAIFFSLNLLNSKRVHKLIASFIMILCMGSLYCLVVSCYHYFSGAPVSRLFYHELVKPLSQHAVQYSVMVFIALVLLVNNLKEKERYFFGSLMYFTIGFLFLFLLLLSSKLIISFSILYLLHLLFFNRPFKTRILISAFVVIAIGIILTANPVGDRFSSMVSGNSMLFAQHRFSPGVHFNGAQFRLLEWRFTFEILIERQAWMAGLTPGDAQYFLDAKYRESNMNTGIPGSEKQGFLGYHTHNQLLQVLLENGVPGLIAFLLIGFSLVKMMRACKMESFKWVTVLLMVYCFTDAPLKTQYGIVIFTFFPVFFYWGHTIRDQRPETGLECRSLKPAT